MKAAISRIIDCIIWAESAGKADAVSSKGAIGLMQIMPKTWAEWAPIVIGEHADPLNAEHNKEVGTAYFDWLLGRYEASVPLALAAYNWGLGHVDRLIQREKTNSPNKLIPLMPEETQKYVTKIMKRLEGHEK